MSLVSRLRSVANVFTIACPIVPFLLLVLPLCLASTVSQSLLWAADAPVGVARYRGIHPLWPQTGGFCYIDVPHVHNKRPTDLRTYRVLPGEENLYVGDPVALGYDGTRYPYFGPHPLAAAGLSASEPVYCYLRGPHFHAEQPPAGASFVFKAGVYWFIGTFLPAFERDLYNMWVNDAPVLTSYEPPQVSLADAPPGYVQPAALRVKPVVPGAPGALAAPAVPAVPAVAAVPAVPVPPAPTPAAPGKKNLRGGSSPSPAHKAARKDGPS